MDLDPALTGAGEGQREFADGEHKSRPMADVRGEDVYALQGLEGGQGASVNDRLVRLLFQPVLVAAALWSTGAWATWRSRRRAGAEAVTG